MTYPDKRKYRDPDEILKIHGTGDRGMAALEYFERQTNATFQPKLIKCIRDLITVYQEFNVGLKRSDLDAPPIDLDELLR